MKKIVHILPSEKFSLDYIHFMSQKMTVYHHAFYILQLYDEAPIEVSENLELHYIKSKYQLLYEGWHGIKFAQADAIIVSGFFNDALFVSLFPTRIIRKLYIHFWGGDFYDLREKIKFDHIKLRLKRVMRYRAYKKSAGLIFLIDNEYEKFKEIAGISKKHYVAPMPGDPRESNMGTYRIGKTRKCSDDIINIVIGNSATETNHHVEVFELLKRYPQERMKIYVPLSYGDDVYRKKIVTFGENMFGASFFPIIHFLQKEEYIRFLSMMDIGIYNNDRQQAMGNITLMLSLGNKVFARDDTSMWKRFENEGYKIFPISNMNGMDFDTFIKFDEKDRTMNKSVYDSIDYLQDTKEKWEYVLGSIAENKN